jgi:hypothetical protein
MKTHDGIGSIQGYISRTPEVCLGSMLVGIARGLQYLHGRYLGEYDVNSLLKELQTIAQTAFRASCMVI